MPTYQVTTDKGTYQIDTQDGNTPQSTPQSQSQQPIATDDTSSSLSQASSALVSIGQKQTQEQPNSFNIAGDITKGFLNSVASTVDKVNGAAKLLNNITQINIGTDELSNVSDSLKKTAQQQPTSSNSIVSGIGQFAGSVPDAIAEFAGTGGGVGFIARSAALQAAQEYNKSQSATDLLKGAALGAGIGAVLNKAPDVVEGVGNIIQKWGQTAGKNYLQAVTGATDKEINEIMDNLPTMDINPKSKVEDYGEAKNNAMQELSTLKDNNKNLIEQQKDQNTQIYNSAKSKSDDAVNNYIESNRDAIEDLKSSQNQRKENLLNSNSQNMLLATDAGVQKLADVATKTSTNAANAKNTLDNTLINVFGTASKKIEALEKGATNDVANAHSSLENNSLDYVPTNIIKKELDSAVGTGFDKYYTKLLKSNPIESNNDIEITPGVKLSSLGTDAQQQYLQQTNRPNISNIARSGNTNESLVNAPGIKNSSVTNAIKLINDTKRGLVDEFSKTGKTSLVAMDAQSDALESAINKGFYGKGVPEGLAKVLANIKNAINPTKLFDKYPKELSHLEPLASANKQYSSNIDNLKNALNLYKDNVDGTVNPQKVFNALDRGDSSYLAKLRQADEALPKEDRIFNKVQDAYNNYRNIENSEKMTLSQTEKEVSRQRLTLNKKFDDMRKQLNIEHRKELVGKIKETRSSNRQFSQQESSKLQELHSKQKQAIDMIQTQKDKELQTLQDSINKRLNSLHLLHMVRGSRASATGTARIFQNVSEYRSIDGLTTLNPIKMAQGKILSKFSSPVGVAGMVKESLNAPNSLKGLQNASENVILKRLVANKLSGR